MRVRRTLSAGWQFAPELEGPARLQPEPGPDLASVGPWRPIAVPGYWQDQFPDLTRAAGAGWYRLIIDLDELDDVFRLGDGPDLSGAEPPNSADRNRLSLRFGAVSHFCQGWLNGVYLGENEGGNLPFSWDITDSLQPGANKLAVRVVTPSGDSARYPEFPFDETIHGKQSWYGPTGGIWQPVVLEAHGTATIDHVTVRPDPDTGRIDITAEVGGVRSDRADGVAFDATIVATVTGPDGSAVADGIGKAGRPLAVVPTERPQLWSPDDPACYTVTVELVVGDRTVDRLDITTGFRRFEADDEGRFRLNGKPLLMRGVLDQDYYDTPGVPGPEAEARLVERFQRVKAMGFNTLRCHIKTPDPAYLDAADEVGLLVWCELPSTTRLTERSLNRIRHTLDGMIRRDHHHPSLVIWTVVNESWGFDLVANPDHRRLLGELYRLVKQTDPDRLVVDNSPCDPNFHLATDIDDYHFYALIPEMRQEWDEFLERFASRDPLNFGPASDIERTGREPLVVSEFGTWGLPELSWVDPDNEPWWFESGQEWARGGAYVHGYRQRFRLWHLDRVFGSWSELCRQTQHRQFQSLRYQIDSMRRRSELGGYVLTELSDVHWEANGLLDMAGHPRSFVDRLPALNASTRVLIDYRKPVARSGQEIEVGLHVASGDDELMPCELHWRFESGHGRLPVGAMAPTEVKPAATIVLDAPEVSAPIECVLTAELVDDDQSRRIVRAESDLRLVVFPSSESQTPDTTVAVRNHDLADRLDHLGYSVVDPDHQTDLGTIRVVHTLTDNDHRFVRAGGRVLLLAGQPDALGVGFADFPRITLEPWDKALHDGGRWVSAFPWLSRRDVFADLPGGPMFDLIFDGLEPDVVITGVPPARFQHAVHAGVFVGWIHQVAALIAEHDVGLGRLLISTLTLTAEEPGSDPAATWLLHRLIAAAEHNSLQGTQQAGNQV